MSELIRVSNKNYEILEEIKIKKLGKNRSFDTIISEILNWYLERKKIEPINEYLINKIVRNTIFDLKSRGLLNKNCDESVIDSIIKILTADYISAIMILINRDLEVRNKIVEILASAEVFKARILEHEKELDVKLEALDGN